MIDVANVTSWRRRAAYAAGIAAAIACNLLLFAPLTLYVGNADEFSVSFSAILSAYLLPGLALVIAITTVGALVPASGFARFISFLAALPVLFWLQGTILVWDYGVLDGRPIPWVETGWRGAIDTTLWVAILLTALFGFRRFGGKIVVAAFGTFAVQIVAGAALTFGNADTVGRDPGPAFDPLQYDALSGFSTDRNVLQFVMDGFQSDVFDAILSDPANSHLLTSLDGFTFFERHVGTFPYTQMTLPLIASGRVYRNEVPTWQFTEDAMINGSILGAAEAAGFEVDIAAQEPLRNIYGKSAHTNSYAIPFDFHTSTSEYVVSDAVRLADLALFRLAPHFVKAYIYEDGFWLLQPRFRDASYLSIRYFADLAFLERIAAGLRADREAPVYKLFHVMLSHRPTVANEHCEFDGIRRTSRANVTIQARCGLERVVAILDAMKRIDVYDNTLIILMADHGAWVPLDGFADEETGALDSTLLPTGATAGMAVALLAVKPMRASGSLATSDAPTTIADVPATVAEEMGFDASFGGRNVFDIGNDEERVRTFFDYAYGDNREYPGYLYTMSEYEITGDPYTPAAWRRVRLHRPEGRIEEIAPVDAGR